MTAVSETLTPEKKRRDWLRRPTRTRGFWSWFTTIDHKKIALMYGGTALVFFVVAGIEALLIRLQLAAPNGTVLTASQYNVMFTMHGTTMVFLVGMPLAVGIGNYLIPLQIGARDVAFPRLNAFGYWVVLFGGIFIYSSFLLGGAPDGGWFGYTPLTSTPVDVGTLPGLGPDFWAVGLIMLGIGSTTSALNLIVTMLNLRAPGMRLMRMPVFCWMMLVVGFLTIFAMPIVTVALTMVWFDRNLLSNFFNAAAGGDPLLYQQLFWLFGHPEVYILILPGMGIISEILPVMSRKPLFGYSVVIFSGIAIGFLGFGVWAHHMFVTGLGPVAISAFALSTMLIAIPTGVKIFNWLATVWGGSLRLNTAMLFSLGFIAMFTVGGVSGVLHAVVPADTQQTDTYFVVAHFHYVLFGGLIFGIFAGFFYWFPLVFGRMMNERLGKVTFWVILVGFNLTFFPMHYLGLQGLPRRTYRYPEGLGFDTLNMMSTVGGFVVAIGVLMLVVNMVVSRFRGEIAGPDPWDARTLEWTVSSYPPPEYNFEEIPRIEARDEFWHRKYTEDSEGRPVRLPSGAADEPVAGGGGGVATLERDDSAGDGGDGGDVVVPGGHGSDGGGHGIHMPSPSYFPFVMALGLPILGYGVVFHSWLLGACGVAVLVFAMYAWALEPPTE